MSTSGTYAYSLTARQIITEAYEYVGVTSDEITSDASLVSSALRSLNILVKSLNDQGADVNLLQWNNSNISSATFTPAVGVVGIVQAFIRAGETDYPVDIIDRAQFFAIANKGASGRPKEAWFDREAGTVHFSTVPDATYDFHHLDRFRYQDFTNQENTPDFPSEALEMLVYGLTHKLALKNGLPNAAYFMGLFDDARKRYMAGATEFPRKPSSSSMIV